MIFYKILVQPAKSSKGICKLCDRAIEQDSLRIQVCDDRQFNDYINSHGGRSEFQGEGMSRGGYIETQNGVISIKRYFVHLNCYQPCTPHPYELDRFRLQRCNQKHRSIFQQWLEERQKEQTAIPPKQEKQKKTKNKKQSDGDDEDYGARKTKKINKSRKA